MSTQEAGVATLRAINPEEGMIKHAFAQLGIARPSYLDIGAFHPVDCSNTFELYQQGSRGINVEPNPRFLSTWQHHRPGDINLNIGVGAESGAADYYEIEGKPQLNTFSAEEMVKALARCHKVRQVSRMVVLSLPDLLRVYSEGVFPDLLSVDAEGLDETILKAMPLAGETRPKVVCAETLSYTDKRNEGVRNTGLTDFMINDGFEVFGETDYSTIFVRP